MTTAVWALFVSVGSFVVAGFSLAISLVRHFDERGRDRAAAIERYTNKLDSLEHALALAINSDEIANFHLVLAHSEALAGTIAQDFGWERPKLNMAFRAYRRFVTADDHAGYGQLRWMAEQRDERKATLRRNLIDALVVELQDGRNYKRVISRKPC